MKKRQIGSSSDVMMFILAALAVGGFLLYENHRNAAKESAASATAARVIAEGVAAQVRKMGLPRMVDDMTRIDAIRTDGLTVTFTYTIFDQDPNDAAFGIGENNPYSSEAMKDRKRRDRNRFLTRMINHDVLPNLRRSTCAGSGNLLRAGGYVVHEYYDHRSLPITNVRFTGADCG